MHSEQEHHNIEAGSFGVEFIGDTAVHTGPFGLLLPLADSVISAIDSDYLASAWPEKTRIRAVADVSESLDGKSFTIYDASGSVEVWFKTSAGTAPGVADRDIEVDISEDDTAAAVAAAVAVALANDGAWTTFLDGDVIEITDVASGERDDGSAGDSGFTVTVLRQGAAGATPLATKTLPKGVPVWIPQIKSITLTSGSLLAYRMPFSTR